MLHTYVCNIVHVIFEKGEITDRHTVETNKLGRCSEVAAARIFRSDSALIHTSTSFVAGVGTVEPHLTDTSLLRTVPLVPTNCSYILYKENLYNTDPL